MVLVEFSMQNFMSFKTTATLSAETGERLSRLKRTNTLTENGIPLLKNLLIFGPNGAGKTTLLTGLRWMKRMVLQNLESVTMAFPAYQPYRLAAATTHAPIMFRVKFNYRQTTYRYEFAFNQTEIVAEELAMIQGNQTKIYFKRERQTYSVLPAALTKLAPTTKRNTLFLFMAQQMNDSRAIEVMQWFENDLLFVDEAIISEDLVGLMADQRVKKEFLQILHFADFNITDIHVRQVARPKLPLPIRQLLVDTGNEFATMSTTLSQLFTVHKRYDDDGNVVGEEELPLASESKGTQKIFVIGLSMINAQINGNGKTLLFDEFDDSLHFELSKALIKIFNSVPNQNQFILTTHELQLLNVDVRVDQVYLVEKNFQGSSDLKSIFDFSDTRTTARQDVRLMKRYIQGRFGALPTIDTDEMLTALAGVNPEGERKWSENLGN